VLRIRQNPVSAVGRKTEHLVLKRKPTRQSPFDRCDDDEWLVAYDVGIYSQLVGGVANMWAGSPWSVLECAPCDRRACSHITWGECSHLTVAAPQSTLKPAL
jgi:hypothetical protein